MQNKVCDCYKYTDTIRSTGLKITKLRMEIFCLLFAAEKPLSIKDISEMVHSGHFVSVYRSVYAMQKAGVLKTVPHGFKSLFEPSDLFKPHHHHITCDECGAVVAVNSHDIEFMIDDLVLKSGFKSTGHHLEIRGVCPKCINKTI